MKLFFFFFLLQLVSAGCSRQSVVTVVQPHIIERIDTAGRNLRLHLVPAGPARSIYGKPFHAGDTLHALQHKRTRL